MVFFAGEKSCKGVDERHPSTRSSFDCPHSLAKKSFRQNEKVQQTIGCAQTAASVRCERYEVDLVVIEVHPLNAVETR
jgi:hypothetical protein